MSALLDSWVAPKTKQPDLERKQRVTVVNANKAEAAL